MCVITLSSPVAPTSPLNDESTKKFNVDDSLSSIRLHLSEDLLDDEKEKNEGKNQNGSISAEIIVIFIGLLELLCNSLIYTAQRTRQIMCCAEVTFQLYTFCICIQTVRNSWNKAYKTYLFREKRKKRESMRKNPMVTLRKKSRKSQSGSDVIFIFIFDLLIQLTLLPCFRRCTGPRLTLQVRSVGVG